MYGNLNKEFGVSNLIPDIFLWNAYNRIFYMDAKMLSQ